MSVETSRPTTYNDLGEWVLDQLDTDVEAGRIDVRPAFDAEVCGALGCRKSDSLLKASIVNFGTRVLCLGHLDDLLQREQTA